MVSTERTRKGRLITVDWQNRHCQGQPRMTQGFRDPALLLGQHRDLVVRAGLPHPVPDLPVQVQSLAAQVTRLSQLAQPPVGAAQVAVGVGLGEQLDDLHLVGHGHGRRHGEVRRLLQDGLELVRGFRASSKVV